MSKTSVTASAEVPTQHMTVDGIEIDVLEGAISDYDVMEASHDANDPSLSPADRTRYEAVLERADERILLSPVYHAGCFHVRNDYLVDHASLLLCYYNGTQGGTRYTVRRALKAGLPVVNLYP